MLGHRCQMFRIVTFKVLLRNRQSSGYLSDVVSWIFSVADIRAIETALEQAREILWIRHANS
jgi:hypothetical protein